MNLSKLINRITEIEKEENKKINDTKINISNLKDELVLISEKLENSYKTGDLEDGEKLYLKKLSIEEKINYYETFLSKREKFPLISEKESLEMNSIINENLMKTFLSDKELFEDLLKKLIMISENGKKAIKESCEYKDTINKLSKRIIISSSVNPKIHGFYNVIDKFVSSYQNNTKKYLESKDD